MYCIAINIADIDGWFIYDERYFETLKEAEDQAEIFALKRICKYWSIFEWKDDQWLAVASNCSVLLFKSLKKEHTDMTINNHRQDNPYDKVKDTRILIPGTTLHFWYNEQRYSIDLNESNIDFIERKNITFQDLANVIEDGEI